MEINYICSLGSWCLPAVYLSENKLQRYSYPFDYIISSPEMVVDCLKDDFKLFLDKSRYEDCGEGSNHTLYGRLTHSLLLSGDRILNNTFRHHKIISERDYNSFVRKVNRFRLLLDKPEPKLFLLFSQLEEFTKKQIEDLDNILKMKTKNYELVFITMLKDDRIYHTIEENNNIKNIKLYTNDISRDWLSTPGDIYLNQLLALYYKFNLKDDIKL